MHTTADPPLVTRKVTEKITFSLREDGIFCTECPPNTVMTLEDGIFSTKMTNEIQGGVAHPLLCDLSNVIKITKDCREHFAGESHAKTIAITALVVTNPISKIIGNFFMGLNKPLKKTRLFTDREKAIEWLKLNQ